MSPFKEVTLKEIGELARGKSKHRPRYDPVLYGGKYPFIQTGDVKNATRTIIKYEQTYNETGLAQSRLWPKGTLCITIAANIAESAILGMDACFPDSVVGFIPDKEKCNVNYIYYFLQAYKKKIQNLAYGTVQENINLKTFDNVKIPLPPLGYQELISSILSGLDDKIELNRGMNRTLEQMAMTLYKHWFVDFSPFQEGEFVNSELGMIPKGWRVGTLGELILIQNGYAFKSKEWKEQGVPVIKIKNINPPLVNTDDVAYVDSSFMGNLERFVLKQGDLLIGMTGAEIGKCGVYYHKEPAFLNQRVGKFSSNIDQINTLPLVYVIARLPNFQQMILDNATGSAQPNISAEGIRSLKIVLPPTNMLAEFINKIKDNYFMIIKNAYENIWLTKTRDYLLPRLLSGDIDVSKIVIDQGVYQDA